MKYDVTIVVPIYNVAKYIEKCALSLFSQSYDNIEFVFVNDCTLDDSIDVLERVLTSFPNRKRHVKIIHKSENEGLGLARKTGVENASGECILHVDSDDWIRHDTVVRLINEYREKGSDIIFFDYREVYYSHTVHKKQDFYKTFSDKNRQEYIKKALTAEIPICSIWGKLCKRELYDGITYSEFSYAEDLFVHIQLLNKAEKISYITEPFYFYNRMNLNSITQKISMNKKQVVEMRSFYEGVRKLIINGKLDKEILESLNIGILYRVIYVSDGDFKGVIRTIAPEADKIRYVIKNKNFSLIKKIVYCSLFTGKNSFYRFARKFVNKGK